jgi:hypothetical protein
MTHKGTCSGASTNSFQSISFITEATGHAHSGIDVSYQHWAATSNASLTLFPLNLFKDDHQYLSPSLFGVSGLQESCLPSA